MSFKVLKNFAIYSSGAIILKIISAVITFGAISFLEPEQFGLLTLANIFIGLVPIILNLGLRQVFALEFFHINSQDRKSVIHDIILVYLIFSIPVLILSVLNISLINKYFFLNQATLVLLMTSLIISFLYFFTELLFQVLRLQSKALILAILQISSGLINLFFSIILIRFFSFKIEGIFIANLVSMVPIAFYGLFLYYKKINYLKFSVLEKKKVINYLKLGLPFIPSIFFNLLISYGDRWILAKFSSMHDVGIYSLADSFGQIYQTIILIPLSNSYLPYIFEKFSKNKEQILEIDKQNYKNMWLFMLLAFFAVTICFFSFKNIFYFLLPIKYYNSINYIWLILIEQIIFTGSYFATSYLVYLKQTYLLVSFTVFCAIFNLLLNMFLIPTFGIYGCITSTMIAYAFYLALIILVSKQVKAKAQFVDKVYVVE